MTSVEPIAVFVFGVLTHSCCYLRSLFDVCKSTCFLVNLFQECNVTKQFNRVFFFYFIVC